VALSLPVFWLWMVWNARKRVGAVGPEPRRPVSWRDYGLLILSGLVFSGDLSSWHWSITLTTVANATLLANLAPVFVTLIGWALLGHRFRPVFLAGLALALTGVALLLGGGQGSAGLGVTDREWLGDGLALVAACFYAGYFLVVSRLRREFSTATIMTWSAGVTALATLGLSLAAGDRLLPLTMHGWLALAGLALFSHAAGQGLIAYAMAFLPPAFTAVTVLLQPVVAAVIAWAWLGERLGFSDMAAMAVVLAGVALARRGSR
jgi:drug/metabolite transporter (DMT)-like permease